MTRAHDEMALLATRLASRQAIRTAPPVRASRKRSKRRQVEAAEPATNVVRLAVANEPQRKRRVVITDDHIAHARRRPRGSARDDQAAPPIFRFPDFPPAAIPPDDGVQMAQDNAITSLNGWANGLALNNPVSLALYEGQAFLGYNYLAQLAQRAEYRKFADRTSTEMTRKFVRLQATGDVKQDKALSEAKEQKIKAIDAAMVQLKVRDAFRELAEQDAFYGRAHLWLDFGDNDSGELLTPIGNGSNDISKLKVGKAHQLKRLKVIEPIWCYPMAYNSNDPLSPDWYKPQQWYVMSRPVHASRIIPFVGREVPDILKPAYAFGGLSLSQMAKPYVDMWLRTRQSVSDIVHSYSTNGIKTDMSEVLTPAGGELFKRMDFFNLTKDNRGLLLLDKDTEEFFQQNAPLGTLDALQAQAQEQMASVVNMPLVILLGIQPEGLNATSEGELRVWYDWVAASQERLFRDPLTRVINFIQLSLFGEVDPEITFKFEPLWSMSEKEVAELQKFQAEADTTYTDGGVLHPEEVRKALAADPNSRYAGLDVDDVPEPPEPDGGAGGFGNEGETGAGAGGPADGGFPTARAKAPGASENAADEEIEAEAGE